MQLLFVCTGNICRSPTAERLARAYGVRSSVENVFVASAGTRAVVGHPIHPDAVQVLERLGGVTTGFSARQLTARIAAGADLIITMTRAHRDSVLELAPSKLHRTFMLGELAQLASRFDAETVGDLPSVRSQLQATDALDVPDPIGLGPHAFEVAGALISDLIPPVMDLCARSLD
ncbi:MULTISPECIES: low molecular weight phosphatase family protein [Mycobacteriaceae]|uniref:Low molecular weight phosphatase family protein n=1 Tax=Mycolicibacterium parafortuitum TaxID=39692 RepID=A0ACC6MJH9_MYCPF|nr:MULTISPECIES: low molecular weight phosphatase family protein [Mycobacteriaceae]MDZ5087116.1 low molecular weight phosphatase family protein [Mycolicibacterium parafortuitum]GFM19202.1 protein tyrosine phosphatase [Mycobacterium sp. PO1]GFM24614.1 protein tyrosine phosphatase [Mycobacterium sp. PO2]